ncbi:MAG: FHA domain-containing protein, partial [Acidobacteriota bacterium]|nr:FHA domain-containing protein [Acidobacteriota bacterium]
IGRGPGVHVILQDPAVSRQHAAIEFVNGRFRVVDLGSTNGILVEGKPVEARELDNGHRFEIGGRVMQLVIEEREATPDTYEITAEN